MGKEANVLIIIVNFNNFTDTDNCLRSLSCLHKQTAYQVIIIDNASTDNSAKLIAKKHPQVTIRYSDKNLGFAGGVNLGLTFGMEQGFTHFLLLNNDCIVDDPFFLTKLLRIKLDMASPIVRFNHGKKQFFDYGGVIDYLFARNTHLQFSELQTGNMPRPNYLSGVCQLISREVIEKTGRFDQGFFMYYEDADYSLRAKSNGFTLGVVEDLQVFHKLSSTAQRLGYKKISILAHSQLRFAKKHLAVYCFPLYFGFHLYLKFKSIISR